MGFWIAENLLQLVRYRMGSYLYIYLLRFILHNFYLKKIHIHTIFFFFVSTLIFLLLLFLHLRLSILKILQKFQFICVFVKLNFFFLLSLLNHIIFIPEEKIKRYLQTLGIESIPRKSNRRVKKNSNPATPNLLNLSSRRFSLLGIYMYISFVHRFQLLLLQSVSLSRHSSLSPFQDKKMSFDKSLTNETVSLLIDFKRAQVYIK